MPADAAGAQYLQCACSSQCLRWCVHGRLSELSNTSVHMPVCAYRLKCVRACVYIFTPMCAYICVCVCMRVCMSVCKCAYTDMRKCLHVNMCTETAYAHTHTHSLTHKLKGISRTAITSIRVWEHHLEHQSSMWRLQPGSHRSKCRYREGAGRWVGGGGERERERVCVCVHISKCMYTHV